MTPVFDPFHPRYFDEADLRGELGRVQTICGGCRACVDLCGSFPRLFDLLDRKVTGERDALTASEQDSVVDGCFDCGLCVLGCPDSPARSDRAVDVPRLMARARQMRTVLQPRSMGDRVAGGARRVFTDLARPRRRTRFSTWMSQRALLVADHGDMGSVEVDPALPTRSDPVGMRVAIFPTCHVEHHDQGIGRAMVKVLEHSGVRCGLPEGLVCCGAPQLAQGDIAAFMELGRRNVRVLADAIRAGQEVVVPLPSCASVIRRDYVAFVGGSDAELVADHTRDASAHLVDLIRRGDAPGPPAPPVGDHVARSVTLHVPCRVRTQHEDVPGAELLRLAGFDVTVVAGCSSPDRRVPDELRRATAAAIGETAPDDLVGECPAALGMIASISSNAGGHPFQLLAQVYGLED